MGELTNDSRRSRTKRRPAASVSSRDKPRARKQNVRSFYPMVAENTTILDYYRESGFKMVRLSADAKRAVDNGWQLNNVSTSELKHHVERGGNIALQMGEVSDWLSCVDADCTEAVALAPKFLPETLT